MEINGLLGRGWDDIIAYWLPFANNIVPTPALLVFLFWLFLLAASFFVVMKFNFLNHIFSSLLISFFFIFLCIFYFHFHGVYKISIKNHTHLFNTSLQIDIQKNTQQIQKFVQSKSFSKFDALQKSASKANVNGKPGVCID